MFHDNCCLMIGRRTSTRNVSTSLSMSPLSREAPDLRTRARNCDVGVREVKRIEPNPSLLVLGSVYRSPVDLPLPVQTLFQPSSASAPRHLLEPYGQAVISRRTHHCLCASQHSSHTYILLLQLAHYGATRYIRIIHDVTSRRCRGCWRSLSDAVLSAAGLLAFQMRLMPFHVLSRSPIGNISSVPESWRVGEEQAAKRDRKGRQQYSADAKAYRSYHTAMLRDVL